MMSIDSERRLAKQRRANRFAVAALVASVIATPCFGQKPEACQDMLQSPDVFERAKPASAEDVKIFEPYIGEFHSAKQTFDDSEIEYFFAIRYEWFDDAKTTMKFSVLMMIPEQKREVLNSEGYYSYDPFNRRLYSLGAFKRMGAAMAVMEDFDHETGARKLLGRMVDPSGKVTLISDQFELVGDNAWYNRTYACSEETGEWSSIHEGKYTRFEPNAEPSTS